MKAPHFVRALTDAERRALRRGLHSPDAFTLRRCPIRLASDRGQRPSRIAADLGCSSPAVRNARHAFGRKRVRRWIGAHDRRAVHEGGVRIVLCHVPVQAPWRNPIEPKGVHGKRVIVEPERKLAPGEVRQRVCDYYGCPHEEPLTQQAA